MHVFVHMYINLCVCVSEGSVPLRRRFLWEDCLSDSSILRCEILS